jgi:hypothetical protein
MATGSRNDKLDPDIDKTVGTVDQDSGHVLPGPADGDEPPVESTPYSHDELIRMRGAQLPTDDEYWARRVRISLQLRQEALVGGEVHPLEPLDAPSSPPIHHAVPVTVYLSDGDAHRDVQNAMSDLLSQFGLEVVTALPSLEGSWYRAFVTRLRNAETSDELADRLQRVERGIELHLLHKKQAEIDSLQGEAVAKLLTALESTPSALIQIGSVLLVKVDGIPVVRNLTQQELTYLERNPSLLRNPAAILDALQAAGQESLPLATKLISS